MALRTVGLLKTVRRLTGHTQKRYASCDKDAKKGLVLGCYTGCDNTLVLSPAAKKFDDAIEGKLSQLITGAPLTRGRVHVLNNLGCPEYYAVAVTGLGPEAAGTNFGESLNECKENIRIMAANGAKALQDMAVPNVYVDGVTCAEAAAEGATLATWKYQDLKNEADRATVVDLHLFESDDVDGWERGLKKGQGQNTARTLEEMPPNIITPIQFCEEALEILCPCGVSCEVRNLEWLQKNNMKCLLAVARGSHQEPRLLELAYCGGQPDDKPVVMVGKGITFDCGGINLDKCDDMLENKADMAGAAVIVGIFQTVARLGLPINLNALLPLCENMLSGSCMRPGDVLLGAQGSTMRVRNTAHEARVVVSDALVYSMYYKPCLLMSIATLTAGIREALGASASGAFTGSDIVWNEINKAGIETGDRVWRMPLWQYFRNRIQDYEAADLDNMGKARGGDPCLGAAFLQEFVPPVDFLHLDITGVGMWSTGHGYPYLRPGVMTGRPTRTVVEFLNLLSCPQDKGSSC